MASQKTHLAVLDILRAIAAITVCMFHFNDEKGSLISYGYRGVDVFFIISGFIIPLAMYWSKYQFRDFTNFFIRRGIRLYPLFVIVALAEIWLHTYGFSLFGYAGGKTDLTWYRALCNFTLSCDLTGEKWYSPVFWTLAIEAQFYLFIALTFPLIISKKAWVQASALALWIVPTYLTGYGQTVFSWSAFFAMGILAFLYQQKLMRPALALTLFALAMFSHFDARGSLSLWFGVFTVVAILFTPKINCKPVEWLGTLSYSLYLTHIMFGGAVTYQLRQLPFFAEQNLLVVLLATTVSVLGAWPLYKLAEEPFHNLARKFKTKSREKEIATAETNDA